jgi:hypothetical protein
MLDGGNRWRGCCRLDLEIVISTMVRFSFSFKPSQEIRKKTFGKTQKKKGGGILPRISNIHIWAGSFSKGRAGGGFSVLDALHADWHESRLLKNWIFGPSPR